MRIVNLKDVKQLPNIPVEMLKPLDYLARHNQRASSSSMSVTSCDFFQQRIPTSTPLASENDFSQDEESDPDATLVSENLPRFPQSEQVEEAEAIRFKEAVNEVRKQFNHSYTLLAQDSSDSSDEEKDERKLQGKAGRPEEEQEDVASIEQMTDLDSSDSANSSFETSLKDESFSKMIEKDDTCNMLQIETSFEDDPKVFIANLPVDDKVFFLKLPDVIRDPEVKLDFQTIPDGEINVHISDVFSPVHFYFHYEYDVEPLMEKIQEEYAKLNPDQLVISDENIKPGLLVVCFLKYFKKWHRAIVIKPPDVNGKVRLNFIDYGTVANVSKTKVKFMFEKFLRYPRMASRGRLVNLKPPYQERMWTDKQVRAFIEKICNKELKAQIVRRDEVDHLYELEILFKGTNLRDLVIELHLADSFELQPCSINPFCYHFPTFDMLEKEYPTFHERSELLEDGLDFDLLIENNFMANLKRDEVLRTPKLLRLLGRDEYKDYRQLLFHRPKCSK